MEIWEEINEELKKIEKQLDNNIDIIEEAKSVYDKYILDVEYNRVLKDNKKLLQEKIEDLHEIWRLKDEISRLQNLCIDNNIKFRE